METQHDAATMHEDVKSLIIFTVNRYKAAYGGDVDDMIGTANVQFVRCHQLYCKNPERFTTSFTTALVKWIWSGLIDQHRTETHRGKMIYESLPHPNVVPSVNPSVFDLENFMGHLSIDARLIISLIFDTPSELVAIAEGKGGQPRNIRSTIRQQMIDWGWTVARVRESFDEIRMVLS